MKRLALLVSAFAVACSAPSYTHAPSSPTYRSLRAPPTLNDTARQRERLVAEDRRLRAGTPRAAALLHDAVEQIVAELGQACTPRNPGGDGLHWTVACTTETLFDVGRSTPRVTEGTSVTDKWHAVGRIVGDLSRRSPSLPGAPRLRLAVSGFADHIQIANASVGQCAPLTAFWGVAASTATDQASINRALSFCRAANMAREIACSAVNGPCADRATIERSGLAVAVIGGGTARLDGPDSHFVTHLAGPTGPLECPCHRIAPDGFGPSWAATHHDAVDACPAEAAPPAPPALFDCDGARRVELDLWLEVAAGNDPNNACQTAATDPDSRALVCLQDAVSTTSHEHAQRPPAVQPFVDRCTGARTPEGWIEARVGTHAPCVAELPQ